MGERLIRSGVLVVLVWLGCTRANPAYRPDAGGSGGGGMDAGADVVAPPPDTGTDVNLGLCTTAADCTDALPCGAWQCNAGKCVVVCAMCTGDMDGDGYGTGPGCAGQDCNDKNPLITTSDSRACYSGLPATTRGIGACRDGVQLCANGSWSACAGQVTPATEACNGEDDDCNNTVDDTLSLGTTTCGLGVCETTVAACAAGAPVACTPGTPASTTDGCNLMDDDCDGAIDEDCPTACAYVVPGGDDLTADGTIASPFGTIQGAITWSSADANRAKNVCITAGAACAALGYDLGGERLRMADGVSVLGGFDPADGTRCPATAGVTVTISSTGNRTVELTAGITKKTILDGVRINRSATASNATGIEINGAKGVLISNVIVSDPAGSQSNQTSYGITLSAGAQATITRSAIYAGSGTSEAIGIRSVGSKPTIRENCSAFSPATGGCVGTCGDASLGIRGRIGSTAGTSTAAILLDGSSGAVVDRNTICQTQAATAAGVRITNAADDVIVRGNTIMAGGGAGEARGVWLDPCVEAGPRIVGNELIQADSSSATARVAAVGSTGNCHPVIDGNLKITGVGSTDGGNATGVFCSTGSHCKIVGNKLIEGSPSAHPAAARAIDCQMDGCMYIARNVVRGSAGVSSIAISIAGSGPLVERNDITGGCGSRLSYGVLAEDAFARIQNNVIRGAACGTGATTTEAGGIHVHVATGQNETEVHSNTIDGGGSGTCKGAAVALGIGTGPAPGGGRRGVFRNNIMRAGGCSTRYDFWEDDTGTSPRLVENNDFDPTGSPTALYFSRNANLLTTLSGVNNSLSGIKANVSVDPMFVGAPNDLHLGSASGCANTGTSSDAPNVDFDGKARDTQPDIGAFER